MKSPVEFSVDSGPGTTWKISVTVWPTKEAMWEQRVRKAKQLKVKLISKECNAHCFQLSTEEAIKCGRLAEMHFHVGDLTIGTIVHESFHAVLMFGHMAKLDFNYASGEEIFAESLDYVVHNLLRQLKAKKIRPKI